MEIFNFSDFDDKFHEYRVRNFQFTYKLVAFVLIGFMSIFIYRYKYANFWPLFLFLYLSILSSYPVVKWLTKNIYKSILTFFIVVTISLSILIFMAGGIRAPGLVWMIYMPTLGGGLLGRRGFLWGIVIIVSFFIIFSILKYMQIEMYPFPDNDAFQRQLLLNLIVFAIASFYYADTHTRSEVSFNLNLQEEKTKNETLLRILFHDLANPMQTIRMLIRKMKKNEERENLDRNLEQLDRTALRIVEILDNVRKMKAVEDQKFVFNKEWHNISDSVLKAVELFEKQAQEKNIKIEIIPALEKNIKILTDQSIFAYQVLGNLISNSIKFSSMEGVIKISWWTDADNLFLSIEDNGIGIPKEILDHIFEAHGQVSRRGTNGEMGTGYGMPLVRAFVQEFEGEIQINSPIKKDHQVINGTQYLLRFKYEKE